MEGGIPSPKPARLAPLSSGGDASRKPAAPTGPRAPRKLQPSAMRQRPSGIIKEVKAPAIDWDSDDTCVLAAVALARFVLLDRASLTRYLSRTVDVYSTESDSAGEEDSGPNSQQGSTRPIQPGQGLQGRKLQLGYGGGIQGAGASFRTPEQEAAEDARRMRLFRGMQATVVLAVLSTAVMIALAIIEGNAAVGCSVDAVVTRTDEFTLTIDTTRGLHALTASTFAGGITVLRNMATQGRPIVTVSVALFARNDLALGQLAPTASIVEDALSVTISAPDSALKEAARCAWAIVTIKLPALNPGWEPISPRLVAEIGNAADRELETEDKPSWPWAVSGLGTVMNNVEGAPGSETTTSADLDAASLGIEIRSDRASDPMEFASLSLRTSHGGIRLTNVAWLASVNEVPVVLAQATRGSLVVDGLSAAADPAAFGDIRGQLSFWTKEGDAKVSRVRVSGPTLIEVQSILGSVWVNDVRLDNVPEYDNAGGPGAEQRLRVVAKSVKGDARVGLASSAGAIGGGSYELRAPFGSVVLAESRLISKPGVDTRALEVEYGSQTSQERVSLLESDSEDINHATVLLSSSGWKGASELPSVSSRGGMVAASDQSASPQDVPRWAADAVGEVAVWSGAVRGVASLTIVEELAPTLDDRATATFPTIV